MGLTADELRQLFDAVRERDMSALQKQQDELKKLVEHAQATIKSCRPINNNFCPGCDKPYCRCECPYDQIRQTS